MLLEPLFVAAFIRALMHVLAFVLSSAGALLIVWGGGKAARRIFWIEAEPWKGPQSPALEDVRRRFGQRILLGVEFFLAGDLLRLLTEPGLQELLRVGVIVLIRVILGAVVMRELQGTFRGTRPGFTRTAVPRSGKKIAAA